MIVLDTNVVSEIMREEPNRHVALWAARQSATALTTTSVTLYEIESGIRLLPAGRRRESLQQRWERMLDVFESRIVAFDVAAARETGRLLTAARATGRTVGVADAQIAGCALAAGFALATRNVKDFDFIDGLELIDPFEG